MGRKKNRESKAPRPSASTPAAEAAPSIKSTTPAGASIAAEVSEFVAEAPEPIMEEGEVKPRTSGATLELKSKLDEMHEKIVQGSSAPVAPPAQASASSSQALLQESPAPESTQAEGDTGTAAPEPAADTLPKVTETGGASLNSSLILEEDEDGRQSLTQHYWIGHDTPASSPCPPDQAPQLGLTRESSIEVGLTRESSTEAASERSQKSLAASEKNVQHVVEAIEQPADADLVQGNAESASAQSADAEVAAGEVAEQATTADDTQIEEPAGETAEPVDAEITEGKTAEVEDRTAEPTGSSEDISAGLVDAGPAGEEAVEEAAEAEKLSGEEVAGSTEHASTETADVEPAGGNVEEAARAEDPDVEEVAGSKQDVSAELVDVEPKGAEDAPHVDGNERRDVPESPGSKPDASESAEPQELESIAAPAMLIPTEAEIAQEDWLDVETLPPTERSFAPAAEHAHSAAAINSGSLAAEWKLLDPPDSREVCPDAEEWFPPACPSLSPPIAGVETAEPTSADPQTTEPAMMLFPSNCPDGTVYLSSLEEPSPGWVDDDEDDNEQLVQRSVEKHNGIAGVVDLGTSVLLDKQVGSASSASDFVQVVSECLGSTDSRREDMEVLLRVREAELRQMRADYEARVRRSADLREQLEAQGKRETPASLRVAVSETKARIDTRAIGMCRSMTAGEDSLAQGMRLLGAKDQEINFLERRVHEVHQKTERLVHAREPVSDLVAQEALQEKQQQIIALKADTEAQEEKLAGLSSDLRSIIDYMMRVNIEAAGGPARDLTANEFLPEEVRQHLTFGEHTQILVGDLVSKYEACMAQCQERATSSSAHPSSAEHGFAPEGYDNRGSNGRLQGRFQPPSDSTVNDGMTEADSFAAAAALKRALKPSLVTGLGPTEKPTTSFAQEAKLLRELFAVEMRSVSCALAEEDAAMRGNPRMRHILVNRELLRAAAWGDEGTLQELLPAASRSRPSWPLDTEDPALKGWTPWHAAAAHGQCGALTILQRHLARLGVPENTVLQQLTDSGLPPLAVACLRGQVEVVKSMLGSQAPLDACGTRGNTALHWAVAASSEGAREILVQVLLLANADPDMPNGSGQCVDLVDFSNNSARASLASARSGSADQHPAGKQSITSKAGDVMGHRTDLEPYIEHVGDPYHIIEAVGAQQSEKERGFLTYTLSMLKVPVRDGVGFARIEHAKTQARLSPGESEVGVWSEWVTNYTHAGLQGAVDATQTASSPSLQAKSRQALVLTCERLLFFNAATWTLAMVVPISDVVEVQVFSYSSTVLLLRTSRRPDMLLDMAARSRFLDELQVAGLQFSNRWGGEDFADQTMPITSMPQLIVSLHDQNQEPAGVIAFIETNVFLLIPFAPSSLLLAGAKTAFFGFLDIQRIARPVDRKHSSSWWQVHFFVLKEGIAAQRKLLWCHHPNDEAAVGQMAISNIRNIDAFETPSGEPCFAIDFISAKEPGRFAKLTLRASSAQCREDWISSIKTLAGEALRS